MSLDFSAKASQPQHGLYGQPDLDPSFNIPNSDNTESMDTSDHSNYDLFPSSASNGSLSSQAYRTNASSSSSLGHGYGMNSESLYSHPPFNDSVPSFTGSDGGNPYGMMPGLPSSYNSSSSGKVSPLTPSDSVSGFNPSPDFPPSIGVKDFQSNYPDIERRLPGAGYSQSFDDYAINNMNGGINYPSNGLQPYPERLGRFPPEHRYNPSGPVPPNVSNMPPGVSPHATHGVPFEGMPHYQPDPHHDMSLRMPTVDETLARMRLHPIMGQSNDLQTFIR
ncbi:hypothetical protein NP233_g10640 [Leucocoprinus birnbaumii]|uniref:Uncharacterized protein n=1 Tax=Leucocoprinus birnbaumii TaxID=56174 RepID=A0AAD5VK04_9AGAR|nr:hypothetical protein NP233_g10640 [Leucocoprinus birnbaumii]